MIKTVLLDLDDTILDFKMSERVALTKTLNELSIEPTEEIIIITNRVKHFFCAVNKIMTVCKIFFINCRCFLRRNINLDIIKKKFIAINFNLFPAYFAKFKTFPLRNVIFVLQVFFICSSERTSMMITDSQSTLRLQKRTRLRHNY